MVSRHVPYHCPLCTRPGACGFNGLLVFEGDDAPTCRHDQNALMDIKPQKACHPNPTTMVPTNAVRGLSSQGSMGTIPMVPLATGSATGEPS